MKEFSELYRLYSEKIYKYLLYLTCNKHEAEELLQETFFQAFKSISRFKGESSISTWLFSIARNVYLKKYNDDKKRDEISLELENIIGVTKSPLDELEAKEEECRILKAINLLDETYRQVVILRSLNELSFREIGEILNKNENWARVTFYRGKVKLGKELYP
ncbi:RNA polymerase sigma factor [Clostridium gasigenes]|uniref:RNA polymerase sigma factor n=1 Tax=Clostridium gasigenes TaxID=94869 RepID=UPI001C0D03CB|nr:RNA polymerase sigma factor [Clostridium gasigenes]MBU3105609.1 RNA polymerase sigma factor [Clostridium gasigenes]